MFSPTKENLPPVIDQMQEEARFASDHADLLREVAKTARGLGNPYGEVLAEKAIRWDERHRKYLGMVAELTRELTVREMQPNQ